jgi:radical SAM protein with 4Fe4S-binding SPASM domain
MKFCVFERIGALVRSSSFTRRTYDCQEPWIGIFSVGANGDVTCCPCYAKAKVGNVDDSSIQEIWNSKVLLSMRKAFKRGRLPRECRGQLCPVVVGKGKPHGEERPSAVVKVQRQEDV